MKPMPDKFFIDTNIVIYTLGKPSAKTTSAKLLFVSKPTISTLRGARAFERLRARLWLSISEDVLYTEACKSLKIYGLHCSSALHTLVG
jgi:hypothetical protein